MDLQSGQGARTVILVTRLALRGVPLVPVDFRGVDLEGAEDELVMKCLFHLMIGLFNEPLR